MKVPLIIALIFTAGLVGYMLSGSQKISYADEEVSHEYARALCDYRTAIEIGSNGKVELSEFCARNGFK